jgi:hypothetical protein
MTTPLSTPNVTVATQGPTEQAFCITCGFNFGHIAPGIDDRVMGFLLAALFVIVLCLPCVIMSGCYLFGKKDKKKTKAAYETVDTTSDDKEAEE